MKIFIAADHAGFELKNTLLKFLNSENFSINDIQVIDLGCSSPASVDYPDYAHLLSENINQCLKLQEIALGILVCGSGQGMSIAANKHAWIRAALCYSVEIASLARKHNDANVICLGSRFQSVEDAKNLVQTFLETSFEGGRHLLRVEKI